MYALVDCNNFYASCERIFRPDLKNKPIMVLSNNDGCVIACSKEVKDLGISIGGPAFKLKEIIKQYQIHLFSSNYELYGDISSRVNQIFTRYSPEIEIYSIDESFLSLKHHPDNDISRISIEIPYSINKEVGVPVCCGIAVTKTLAKVANRIAKKFPELNGSHVIDSQEKIEKALKWLKIEDVWGIGRKLSLKLKYLGVKTAWDYVQLPDDFIRKNYTVVGLRLKKELLGFEMNELDLEQEPRKVIATTRSFGQQLIEYGDIEGAVANHATRCAEKLRKDASCAKFVTVFIYKNKFDPKITAYKKSITIPLNEASNSTFEIIKYAKVALSMIFEKGAKYKKTGVIVSGLVPQDSVQMNLFSTNNLHRDREIMKVVDLINQKMGRDKIHFLAQDTNENWKMKQELLSRRYTTRIDEIPIIKSNNVKYKL